MRHEPRRRELIEGTNNIVIKKADGTILKTIKTSELNLPVTASLEEIEVAMQAEIQKELKKLQGAGRHANWVEVTDITSKVLAKKPHVLTVENLTTSLALVRVSRTKRKNE